ncbi:serine-threonine kinase receptor-associated protein-like [Dysidea avara]|uniref:serine-threonine kinase receptor-associated protein-like n=1 Tax=Dysidea avara TaxID=196820 RepID=UPI00332B6778
MAKQLPLTCPGHTRPVVHLGFSNITANGGYFLITACKDGKPMYRHGHTGDWIGTFDGHKGAVWGASLTMDASLAGTGAADFTAKLWNTTSGDEINTYAHPHIVKTVSFSNDNKSFATGCVDQVIRVFDVVSGNKEPTFHTKLSKPIKATVWDGKDNGILLASAEEGVVRKYDCRTNTEVQSVELSSPSMVTSVDLSWDSTIVTVAHGDCVSFLQSDSLKVIHTHQFPSIHYSASLHPDKSCFVAGGEDFKLRKCDFVTGNELESYKGHFGPVHCVRYSPDGEVYCSGSEDGTVRLWQHQVGKTYGLWKNNSTTE